MPRPSDILAALNPDIDGPTDAELLRRFADARDAGAFELLVWRHAGLVLRTCRAVLRDHHAAEDAAQAVFLALARQAASVGRSGSAAGWLFRVARRVAARAARRQLRPAVLGVDLDALPAPCATPPPDPDLAPVLAQELARLPERYLAPVLLCLVEGLTQSQAAKRLGWPLGTVAGRLARAKERLAARLTHRGFAVSLLAPAAVAVPPAFAPATTRAAVSFVARGHRVVPSTVLDLARKELQMVTIRKASGLAVAAAVICVGLAGLRVGAEPPAVAPAPRAKPAATGLVPPKAVVFTAWEKARSDLTSGIGEGVFEQSGVAGEPVRYSVKVTFAGPKFWAKLTHLEGERVGGRTLDTWVVIYDGETLAYREVSHVFRPHGEEARIFQAKPGELHRHPFLFCRFNPTRLQFTVLDLPAFVRNRPETTFAFIPDGVAGSVQLSEDPPIQVTLRFPRDVGYNVASFAVLRADTGSRQLAKAKWDRSNGVWYVREVEDELTRPGEPRSYQRLTYTSFEANPKVDPALFRLPALGLAAGARLIHMDFAGDKTDFYAGDPTAPSREGDTLLDGLRRLPFRHTLRPLMKK